jgi:hypothetical protein
MAPLSELSRKAPAHMSRCRSCPASAVNSCPGISLPASPFCNPDQPLLHRVSCAGIGNRQPRTRVWLVGFPDSCCMVQWHSTTEARLHSGWGGLAAAPCSALAKYWWRLLVSVHCSVRYPPGRQLGSSLIYTLHVSRPGSPDNIRAVSCRSKIRSRTPEPLLDSPPARSTSMAKWLPAS